jgi:hypothetical protein
MTKPRRYSYDPVCENLAEYFLPTGASERLVRELSQAIQDTIESWMGYEMVRLQAEIDGKPS